MAIKREVKITANTSEAVKEVDKLSSSVDNTANSVEKSKGSLSGLTGTLDKFTGGAVTKIKGFTTGLKGMALGFNGVGLAVASSGIGLVIIAIAAVGAAFKGSEEGQNKFAKLMAVIGTVIGNVVDVLADLGDFIIDLFSGNGEAMTKLKSFGAAIFNVIGLPIKNIIDVVKALGKVLGALFSGDISGAFDELQAGVANVKGSFDEATESIKGATGALKDFAKQNIDEAKAAAKVADQRAKADKIERDLIVDKAKAERKIADLRLKAKDLNNVSAKEREDALKTVLSIQDELITRETEVLELRRDAQIAENGFARSDKENLDKEQNAIAAVIDAETRRVDQQRAIQRELTAAENEINAERKARAKEWQAIQDENAKSELERLKSLSDFKEALLKKDAELDAKTEDEKLALNRFRAETELENLVGTIEEKREAKIALNAYYDQLEDELAEERAKTEAESKEKRDLIQAQFDASKIEDPLTKLDAEKDILNKQNENLLEDLEAKRAIYEQGTKERSDAEQEYLDFKQSIDNKLIDNAKAKAQEEKRIAETIAEQKKDIDTNLQKTILNIAKEGSAVAKGLAIANIVRDQAASVSSTISATTEANAKAVAASPLTLGQPFVTLNTIQAGIGIAAGVTGAIKSIKAISSDKKSPLGGSSSGGGGGGGGGGASAPSFNLVAGSGTNQIAEGLSQQPTPLRAFVVSSEVTTAQSLDRNIEANASF